MKKIYLFLILFSNCLFALAQVEKTSKKLCDCLRSSSEPDPIKLQQCFRQAAEAPLAQLKDSVAQKEFLIKLDTELEKNCLEYSKIVQALYPAKGDWERLEKLPETKLTNNSCQGIITHKKMYYFEPTGDTTNVTISDGIWLEKLKKGKYISKLGFKLKNNCEFVLTFLESTDPNKKLMSKAGEKYTYRIIDKTDNYYLIATDGSAFYQFKLYFKKSLK